MENTSAAEQAEAIKSFRSVIHKTEKALSQMAEKGTNTTLVKKRLTALQIGLAVLEAMWNEKPHPYTIEDLTGAREILSGLMPSLKSQFEKSKAGSSQKTLLERRMDSMELAIQAIDDLSSAFEKPSKAEDH